MLDPFFLQGSKGRLFCHLQRPQGERYPTRAVLCVPPFAEEMNKSRRMFNVLGQQLAAQDVMCLLPDLFGSGDSEGDFADADWDVWLDDLQRCVRWLQDKGVTDLTLLGLRSGALLSMQVRAKLSLTPDCLVLWQPVPKGKLLLTQFLRIRLASGLTGTSGSSADKETTGSLRARFAAGDSVEVAGYEISSALAKALDAAVLNDFPPDAETPLHWLELVAAEGGSIAPVGKKIVEGWQQQGASVSVQALSGDSFWMTQEITEAPELIAATVGIINAGAQQE